MNTLRSIMLASVMTLMSMSAAVAQGTDDQTVTLDIAPQPLGDALNELAQQANLQLVFYSEVGKGLTSPRIVGKLTPRAALGQLLANTDLRYEYLDTQTVAILSQTTPLPARRTSNEATRTEVALPAQTTTMTRVAQAETPTATGGASPQEEGPVELEEVVVTGTHIRGTSNNTAPVMVLDRAYIESTGLSTTTALIESLPQNFALASESGVLVPGVSAPRTQGAAINLRGLSEGTTLVLLNGRRIALGFGGSAVDISALPLSAIDRVEIMTDGASALYGSDAVGGVVNFILRKDFAGSQTNVRGGWADGGVNEFRGSQTLGTSWTSGNAVVSVDYYKRDLLKASERSFVPSTSEIGSLLPEDENYSGMFSGRQQLTSHVDAFVDALYTHRDSFNESGDITIGESFATRNPQLSATAGLDIDLSDTWKLELVGSYGHNDLHQDQNNEVDGLFRVDSRFRIGAGGAKADGPLFQLPGGAVRMAVGLDWRSESYRLTTSSSLPVNFDQIVRSGFAEFHVPLVGASNAFAGMRRLELEVAGRYDDYSSFGSSLDPRFGLMWEPVSGLRLRGSYGTSYVAPRLEDYSFASNIALAREFSDPQSASGFSQQLWLLGTNVDSLAAQEAESFSFGVELAPESAQGLQVGLNYYNIDYHDRIAGPPVPPIVLANPASFSDLIIRDPPLAQVNGEIDEARTRGGGFLAINPDFTPNLDFTPESVDVIIDVRRRNLSVLRTSGLDLSAQYDFSWAASQIRLGLNSTYVFEMEQRTAPASAGFDTIDTIYNPPSWRARASLGWQHRAWAANLYVNHADAYTDNRVDPLASVSSYTTVDTRVAYDFGKRIDRGFMAGVVLSASAQNLFDRNPPHVAIVDDFKDQGFDPTNANPLGRMVAVELQKTW